MKTCSSCGKPYYALMQWENDEKEYCSKCFKVSMLTKLKVYDVEHFELELERNYIRDVVKQPYIDTML